MQSSQCHLAANGSLVRELYIRSCDSISRLSAVAGRARPLAMAGIVMVTLITTIGDMIWIG